MRAEPWTFEDGAQLPERLEHWDPFTDVEVFRIVDVDTEGVREDCRLGAGSALALAASWSSTRSRLGASASVVELGDRAGVLRATLAVSVPGRKAGGRLDLRTALVLRTAGADASAISPRREGASLWVDESRHALEGGAARFPVAAVGFDQIARLPDAGGWALEWDVDDLDIPVLAGLRLLVNAQNEKLVSALRSGSTDPRATAVRSFVMFDVARALVEAALRCERFTEEPESFAEDSVGRMLFELVTMCWPAVPISTLATRLVEDPARLGAELQAYLGVLA